MSPNVSASIHHRLLNQARAQGRPFNELLQRYALERFLYRLGRSPYRPHFVLKGALLLAAWHAPLTRPTRDVDLLGRMDNAPAAIIAAMRAICRETAPEDGLTFEVETMTGQRIVEGASYAGVRVRFAAYLGKARIPMQVDIGFGDALVPGPLLVTLPASLSLAPAQVQGYSAESVVAEKLQIIAALGEINSRLKDYYDLWLLATHHAFAAKQLGQALQATFSQRQTALAWPWIGLETSFANESREAQWHALLHRHLLPEPASLRRAIDVITGFAGPVICALLEGATPPGQWAPGGPWRASP